MFISISCLQGYKLYEQLCWLYALISWQHWHPRKELLFRRTFVGLHRKEVPPAPPSRGQGQNVSRGGAHVSALKAEKQKEKCWKNKLFSQSNIQDVYRSRGFWTPWVDQSIVCLYSVKNYSTKDWRSRIKYLNKWIILRPKILSVSRFRKLEFLIKRNHTWCTFLFLFFSLISVFLLTKTSLQHRCIASLSESLSLKNLIMFGLCNIPFKDSRCLNRTDRARLNQRTPPA